MIIRNVELTFSFKLGVKYDEADLSAALLTEIFPELVYSSDIQFMLPSKKALRRFPCATVLPRPLPEKLNAHCLLSDRIRHNLAEIADLAVRRLPALMMELDRSLTAKLAHLKIDEPKWRTRTMMTAIRPGPKINGREDRVAIIRHALHIQYRTPPVTASRSLVHACRLRSTLTESNIAGATLASTNANENSSNQASNSFNVQSSNNRIPDSLVIIPGTTLNRRTNNTTNEQQTCNRPTTIARFSIKRNWTLTSIITK